jgi:signal transduction histidine kinase
VELTRSEADAFLVVQDKGRGVAQDVRERRLQPSVSTKGAVGIAIALAMARKLVELCGGVVLLDSQEGAEARFAAAAVFKKQATGTQLAK